AARDRGRGLLPLREVEEVLEAVSRPRDPGTHLRPDRTGIARPPLSRRAPTDETADKELTQAVRALRDPRPWGRWGVPGPAAIAAAAAHTQGPVRDAAAHAPPTSPIGVASWQTFPPQPRALCSPISSSPMMSSARGPSTPRCSVARR